MLPAVEQCSEACGLGTVLDKLACDPRLVRNFLLSELTVTSHCARHRPQYRRLVLAFMSSTRYNRWVQLPTLSVMIAAVVQCTNFNMMPVTIMDPDAYHDSLTTSRTELM